jgi:hypothetical protein
MHGKKYTRSSKRWMKRKRRCTTTTQTRISPLCVLLWFVHGYRSHLAPQAGLFSAVVSGFLVVSLGTLQEDYAKTTAMALYHISLQLHDATVQPLALPTVIFQPASSDIYVNGLWATSLVLSLIAAFLVILVKQWMQTYMSWTAMIPSERTMAIREARWLNWQKWHVSMWRDAIALLLQFALIFFLAGLLILLRNTQRTLAIIVTVIVALCGFVVLSALVRPVWDAECPYRSPFGWLLRLFWRWLSRSQDYSSRSTWDDVDIEQLSGMSNCKDIRPFAVQAVADVLNTFRGTESMRELAACLHPHALDVTERKDVTLVLAGLLDGFVGAQKRTRFLDALDRGDANNLAVAADELRELALTFAFLARCTTREQSQCSFDDFTWLGAFTNFVTTVAAREPSALSYHAITLAGLHQRVPTEVLDLAANSLQRLVGQEERQFKSWSRWPIRSAYTGSDLCIVVR